MRTTTTTTVEKTMTLPGRHGIARQYTRKGVCAYILGSMIGMAHRNGERTNVGRVG